LQSTNETWICNRSKETRLSRQDTQQLGHAVAANSVQQQRKRGKKVKKKTEEEGMLQLSMLTLALVSVITSRGQAGCTCINEFRGSNSRALQYPPVRSVTVGRQACWFSCSFTSRGSHGQELVLCLLQAYLDSSGVLHGLNYCMCLCSSYRHHDEGRQNEKG
jgi:hypothetical protein